jgi:hypothetical protein
MAGCARRSRTPGSTPAGLRAAGHPVRSLLAHPGYASTNLQFTGPTGAYRWFGRIFNPLVGQSAEQGALPQLYAVTDPAADGGQFIGPNRLVETRGYPTVVRAAAAATDERTARRLWSLSEELTGVRYDLPAPA